MFDIGWSELLVIGVVAIVVVGPKELPRLMRTFGTYTGRARRMAADFQRQFEDAVRDSELDEVRKAMQDFRAEASNPVDLRKPIDTPLMLPKHEPSPAIAVEPASPSEPETKPKPKRRAKRPKVARSRGQAGDEIRDQATNGV